MSGYTYDTDFMRKAVGFVPAQSVDMKWSDGDAQGFDIWLAQVKRDAAREALDGYADALNRNRSAAVWQWHEFVGDIRDWAATNYPEDVTP